MSRKLLVLSGLAILAVVVNHAAGWGYVAMFWWTDQYKPVTVPNFDEVGTLFYYALLMAKTLTVFAVPAFLFTSAFFVAYAARGNTSNLSWKAVRMRITNILVPYVIWSAVVFGSEFLQGVRYSQEGYLERLLFGSAVPAYFYVPLLCQLYLLSPLVIPIAKTKWKLLLGISMLVQLGVMSLRYLDLLGARFPGLHLLINMTPSWLFVNWIFFFTFGVVFGFHAEQFKQWLEQFKWGLLVVMILLGMLTILEPDLIFRTTRRVVWGSPSLISSSVYAFTFVLCYLAFDRITIPLANIFCQLGSRVFGIYLLHALILEIVARVIHESAPWLLASQQLLQPLLVAIALGTPVLFMTVLAKSPARRSYRYLFG